MHGNMLLNIRNASKSTARFAHWLAALLCILPVSMVSADLKTESQYNLVYIGFSNLKPFWVNLGGIVRQEASCHPNINLADMTPLDLTTAAFNNSLSIALNENTDGIILGIGQNTEETVALLDQAVQLNIPIIAIDTAVNHLAIKGLVATDNYASALKIGAYLAEKTEGQGTLLLIGGSKNHPNGDARRNGVMAETRAIGMPVLFRQGDWKTELAFKFTQDALAKTNDISAIFCCWDPGILSAAIVVEQQTNATHNIVMAGFDGLPSAYRAIKEGRISATIAQPADRMANEAINMLLRVLQHPETPPQTILIPGLLVTTNNVESFMER